MLKQQTDSNAHALQLSNKRSYWHKIIQEWQLNPIKPREFCVKKNLNFDQFGYWRRKFTDNNSTDTNNNITRLNPGFIEVTQEDINSVDSNTEVKLNITMPNNIQLSLTASIPHIVELVTKFGGIKC